MVLLMAGLVREWHDPQHTNPRQHHARAAPKQGRSALGWRHSLLRIAGKHMSCAQCLPCPSYILRQAQLILHALRRPGSQQQPQLQPTQQFCPSVPAPGSPTAYGPLHRTPRDRLP
jgi:hypothetical protein